MFFIVDFQHERNVLASEAVPQLRTYCHTKGLDLQVNSNCMSKDSLPSALVFSLIT